jgi:N-methylhydantoinase B
MDRTANATLRCFAEAKEGVGMAEFAYCIGAGSSVVSGKDPRTGRAFVNQLFLGFTGGAGAPAADGWLGAYCIGGAGMLMRDSVEVDELRQPIRVVQQRLVPDTEGAGRFCGAPAAMVEFGPVGCSLEVNYTADGTHNPPKGVRGGLEGAGATQEVRRTDGSVDAAPNVARLVLNDGETLIARSCGGGGYGPPLERDPEAVRRNVVDGWISRDRAATVYGVVLDASGAVDGQETKLARESLALSRKAISSS